MRFMIQVSCYSLIEYAVYACKIIKMSVYPKTVKMLGVLPDLF